jgi:hypothetical protein
LVTRRTTAANYARQVTGSPLPTSTTRWRCTRCGNLTRFDVVRRSRTREFVHVDLAGEPVVEEREVLAEDLESVRCRWCDGVGTVELVPRPAEGATDGDGDAAGAG